MNSIKVLLQANLENVSVARGIVSSFLSNEDVTVNVYNEIKTIVSEGVTNAIVHGYQNDSSKFLGLDCYLKNNLLTIIIKDEGIGIDDIEKAKKPFYTSKPESERSGMGFTVMESFMDSVTVTSKIGVGTEVVLIKNLEDVTVAVGG